VFALVAGVVLGFLAGQAEPVPTVAHPVATPGDGPARVLLVGDSILRQTGPALAAELGDGYAVRNVAVNGSGLLTPGVFDWPVRLDEELALVTPDVVVVSFLGNYTDEPDELWVDESGHTIASIEDPALPAAWGRQADALMAAIAPTGAEVVLVLPPTVPVPALQAVVDRLRAEYQRVAARWPFVRLADAAAAADRPEDRTADAVHLSERGRRRLAAAIAAAL
jgi:hypothetical protein